MDKQGLVDKIISKKEFSQLPIRDVYMVLASFGKRDLLDEERVKLSRDLLRKMYTAFVSSKLLSVKDKDAEWFLNKHISTRERIDFYVDLYDRLLKDFGKRFTVFDLGAGVNGFSYKYFADKDINYVGVEAVGQLVKLMNSFFEKNKFNAIAVHESLFELGSIKEIISSRKGKKVIFLFKTLDSLEMLERDFSKELLKEIVPLVDRVVVSFATKSLISRKNFKVNRKWILDFIEGNFKVIDDFELGSERYISFRNASQ